MREPKYHNIHSCNKCRGRNDITVTDTVEGYLCECKTKCTACGFEDYWAYGFYESGEHMESNCEKYYWFTTI